MGTRQEGGTADGGANAAGEAQGGSRRTVNRMDILARRPGQVVVRAESSADVSAYGFWKRGTTTMFVIRIFNLDAGSYLRMTPEKALAKAEKEKKTFNFRLDWNVEGLLIIWSNLRKEYPEQRH